MATSIRQSTIEANGIKLLVAEAGSGPLVILCHGWPELRHSWRHQIPALAEAGYRVAAPDMRGFGGSDAPEAIEAYTILHNVGDMVALVGALGEKRAIIVGHDWGAPVAWHAALMRPDIFPAVVGMSVPYRPRGAGPPLKLLRDMGLETYYWIYFQAPGVAEAELERDVAATMRRLLYSGSGDAEGNRELGLVLRPGKGLLDKTVDPERLPSWLSEEHLALMVAEYRRTGFRGGLNWYRNIDRNWEITAPWQGAVVTQPALFVAGTRDVVIASKLGKAALEQMPRAAPGLKRQVLIEGAGHWIQQERPSEVNAALIGFLRDLPAM